MLIKRLNLHLYTRVYIFVICRLTYKHTHTPQPGSGKHPLVKTQMKADIVNIKHQTHTYLPAGPTCGQTASVIYCHPVELWSHSRCSVHTVFVCVCARVRVCVDCQNEYVKFKPVYKNRFENVSGYVSCLFDLNVLDSWRKFKRDEYKVLLGRKKQKTLEDEKSRNDC